MYYIVSADSNSIELQEAYSASGVVRYASNLMEEDVHDLSTAINVLNGNGYKVFEDC